MSRTTRIPYLIRAVRVIHIVRLGVAYIDTSKVSRGEGGTNGFHGAGAFLKPMSYIYPFRIELPINDLGCVSSIHNRRKASLTYTVKNLRIPFLEYRLVCCVLPTRSNLLLLKLDLPVSF